jgi:hypothetical protein
MCDPNIRPKDGSDVCNIQCTDWTKEYPSGKDNCIPNSGKCGIGKIPYNYICPSNLCDLTIPHSSGWEDCAIQCIEWTQSISPICKNKAHPTLTCGPGTNDFVWKCREPDMCDPDKRPVDGEIPGCLINDVYCRWNMQSSGCRDTNDVPVTCGTGTAKTEYYCVYDGLCGPNKPETITKPCTRTDTCKYVINDYKIM